jgi:hypothetical protein
MAVAGITIGSSVNGYAREDIPRGTIMDRAVCLSVELHRLGTRRRVASTEIQTDADSDMIHVSKEILESDTLEEIKRMDGEIRGYVAKKTVPGMSLFRAGVYLVPVDSLEDIDARLEQFKRDREYQVEKFLGQYQEAAAAARARLGSLYDENDYPAIAKVRAAFSMETKYVAFATPDKLATISSTLYRREEAKMAAAISSATEKVVDALRSEAAGLVDHLVERLSAKPGEKPKVFRDSMIGNIREWLENLPGRNSIAGDVGLSELARKMESLLDGVDPQTLRDNDRAREAIVEGFGAIKAQLDNMIVQRPIRKINLDN